MGDCVGTRDGNGKSTGGHYFLEPRPWRVWEEMGLEIGGVEWVSQGLEFFFLGRCYPGDRGLEVGGGLCAGRGRYMQGVGGGVWVKVKSGLGHLEANLEEGKT